MHCSPPPGDVSAHVRDDAQVVASRARYRELWETWSPLYREETLSGIVSPTKSSCANTFSIPASVVRAARESYTRRLTWPCDSLGPRCAACSKHVFCHLPEWAVSASTVVGLHGAGIAARRVCVDQGGSADTVQLSGAARKWMEWCGVRARVKEGMAENILRQGKPSSVQDRMMGAACRACHACKRRAATCKTAGGHMVGAAKAVFLPQKEFVARWKGRKRPSVVLRAMPWCEAPTILQIGSPSNVVALQAALVAHRDFLGVDLNCGCPGNFSVAGGMGSALLTKPEVVADIVRTLKRNVPAPDFALRHAIESAEPWMNNMRHSINCSRQEAGQRRMEMG